jgi:hypothetical protein
MTGPNQVNDLFDTPAKVLLALVPSYFLLFPRVAAYPAAQRSSTDAFG